VSQLRCVDDTRAVRADDEVQRLEMLFGRRHDHRLALQALMQSSPMRLFQGTGGGLEIFGWLWGERADALTGVTVASPDAVPHCSARSPPLQDADTGEPREPYLVGASQSARRPANLRDRAPHGCVSHQPGTTSRG